METFVWPFGLKNPGCSSAAQGSQAAMPKLKDARYDVTIGSAECTAAHISSITSSVTSRGFCTIQWGVAADTLAAVADEVKTLKTQNALKPLPVELDDGYLGAEGSTGVLIGFESKPGLEALEVNEEQTEATAATEKAKEEANTWQERVKALVAEEQQVSDAKQAVAKILGRRRREFQANARSHWRKQDR